MNVAIFPAAGPDRDEEAAAWCVRLSEKPLGRREQRAFDVWLAQPGNREAFEDAAQLWGDIDHVAARPDVMRHRVDALEFHRDAQGRRYWGITPRRAAISAIAASVLLCIALAVHFMLPVPGQHYETQIGERRVVFIADGSRLSLDAASRVDVRMLPNRRELILVSGRAKFDVAKNPLRPFLVLVGDQAVIATGTSFSVEKLGREVRVQLYEGHVAVVSRTKLSAAASPLTAAHQAAPVERLTVPGGELIVQPGKVLPAVTTFDPDRSLGWEAGELSLNDEPLDMAVERLNRYSKTRLVVADPRLAEVKISGLFSTDDVSAFVVGIGELYGIRAIPAGDGTILLESGRNSHKNSK